jgi:hypothetical protein
MEASVPEGCAERGSNSAPASGDEPGRSGVCSAPAGGARLLGARGDPFPRPGRRTGRTALRRSGRKPTGRCGVRVCAIGSEGALPKQGDPADPACLLSIGRLLVQGRSQGPRGRPACWAGRAAFLRSAAHHPTPPMAVSRAIRRTVTASRGGRQAGQPAWTTAARTNAPGALGAAPRRLWGHATPGQPEVSAAGTVRRTVPRPRTSTA